MVTMATRNGIGGKSRSLQFFEMMSTTKWTNALNDDSAGLNTNAACVALADFSSDGDTKLILADLGTSRINIRMKVFKGVQKINETPILEPPIALFTFINEQIPTPAIGIACGSFILVYKGLRPFYRFESPALEVNGVEAEAWAKLQEGIITPDQFISVLRMLKDEIGLRSLTSCAQKIMTSPESEQRSVVSNFASVIAIKPPSLRSPVTCVSTLKRSLPDVSPIDMLVYGTENGRVYMLDTQAFQNLHCCQLPAPPVFIACHGAYDVDFRVFVSTRDGEVFSIKRDSNKTRLTRPIISCRSHIVAIIKFGKTLAIACADNSLTYYSHKGRRINQVLFEEPIIGLESFHYAPKQYTAVIVALQKEFRIYNEVALLDQMRVEHPLKWIKFGQFGREEAALILGTQRGGLMVKLFRRVARLEEHIDVSPPALSYNFKLNIPKRSRLFIEQTSRERNNPRAMHQMYQRDVMMLRWLVTEQFALLCSKALSSASSQSSSQSVEISVDVNGFGPTFKVVVRLTSTSKSSLYGMWLSFVFNPENFKFEKSLVPVALLTPGHFYTFMTRVEALKPEEGINDEIRVSLVGADRPSPIVTAVIRMPLSEMSLLD